MATRPRGFGLTAEINDKIRAQYSEKDEQQISEWFSQLGLEPFTGKGYDEFNEYLKNGMVLCNLALKLEPGSIRKINDITKVTSNIFKASKSNENIGNFLAWAERYGLHTSNSFQTADLYEGTNLAAVQRAIFGLGGVAMKKGFSPAIGVKVADENRRSFSEQQLRAGETIISKQMGNNDGASQAGMTGYGTGRQIMDRTSEANKTRTDYNVSSLQMGSNKGASQAGMTGYGAGRQIIDRTSEERKMSTDYTQSRLQMGTNSGASQAGQTAPGTRRQIM